MNNNQEITKFEFLLTLEEKFICQRFFNVKGHNPNTRSSMELHEYVSFICSQISEDLKTKSGSFYSENVEDYSDKKNEHFLFKIKINDDVFIQRKFPSYYYPPKVRYNVDIRPRLKNILSNLTEILSYDKVDNTYLEKILN